MVASKSELTARKRGKGGTIVRVNGPLPRAFRGHTLVVKDLFDRKSFNVPTRVGVGPVDMGLAFGVDLADIEVVS